MPTVGVVAGRALVVKTIFVAPAARDKTPIATVMIATAAVIAVAVPAEKT
jgi:hypothetical protein